MLAVPPPGAYQRREGGGVIIYLCTVQPYVCVPFLCICLFVSVFCLLFGFFQFYLFVGVL